MNINNFRMTRDIYKQIYSFMPGLSIRPHHNLIKSNDADDFEFWVERYEAIVKIKRKNQGIIDRTLTLQISVRSQLEKKLYSDRTGDYMELHWACSDGHTEVVKALLEKGADTHTKTSDGETPMLFASVFGNVEVVKVLLEKGADVHAKDSDGYTPLHYAGIYGNIKVATMLQANGAV